MPPAVPGTGGSPGVLPSSRARPLRVKRGDAFAHLRGGESSSTAGSSRPPPPPMEGLSTPGTNTSPSPTFRRGFSLPLVFQEG